MKNRFLTLLTVTMLTGSILVGCGGTETGADNGGTNNESNVNSEVNDDVAAKVDPDSEYTETETVEDDGMSAEAAAYLDKIRNGIVEENKKREEFEEQNPNFTLPPLEETNSPDGLECLDTFRFEPDSEEEYMVLKDIINQFIYNKGYTKYYIEYISESSGVVEFKIYVGK